MEGVATSVGVIIAAVVGASLTAPDGCGQISNHSITDDYDYRSSQRDQKQ